MKKIDIDKLVMMYVVAAGNSDGVAWEVFPNMPDCFTEGLSFDGRKADFLRLTVSHDGDGEVFCWFMYEDEEMFHLSLGEVRKRKPVLYISIVTYVYDMVMNLDEK